MIRHTPRPVSGRQLYLATVMTAVCAWSSPADALPTGFSVQAGAAVFDSGNTATQLQVDQSSNRVVINWDSFNINSGQTVKFQQPGASSIAFNVINPTSFTTINGSLLANGGVWLFSPAGILFGRGSTVTTGSFLASTGVFKEDATSLTTALNSNSIQIFGQATPGQGSIVVQGEGLSSNGCTTLNAAVITADPGFVLLQAPTITQDGTVSASDAVVYNADEGVTVQFAPTTDSHGNDTGLTLLDESSAAGTPSASTITQSGSGAPTAGGSTTAGTWFEADAANDDTVPGSGIINLGGLVTANGMKADTANPSDPHNGFSVILNANMGGSTGTEVDTIDGTGGTITAASGLDANAATIITGAWTNNSGALQIQANGTLGDNTTGAIINGPLVSNNGSIYIAGYNVGVNADVTADGSASIFAGTMQIGAGATIQAGRSTAGSTLAITTVSDLIADPNSTLLVGPSTSAPNGALDVSVGVAITPASSPLIDTFNPGLGGDLTLGSAYAGTMNLNVTGVNGVGGVFTIPDGTQLTSAGAIDIDPNGPVNVDGQIVSATSVFIAATAVNLGADGAIWAGPNAAPFGGLIETNSPTATVTLQNYATNGDTPAVTAGGNVLIGAPLSWATDGGTRTLNLSAYNSLIVGGPITASDPTAQVSLNTGQGGSGDYSFVNGGSLSFTGTEDSNQGLTINGQTYTLIFNQLDLLKINDPSFGSDNAGFGLNGHYALALPLDFNTANTATVFSAAPIANLANTPFFGTFTGLGNTISNLTINADLPISQYQFEGSGYTATNGQVGLFGSVGQGGTVRDVNLINANVTGGDGMQVGALVGHLDGTVQDASASGQVTTGSGAGSGFGFASADAGGLVGVSYGNILNSQATVSVTAGVVTGGNAFAGGLVGSAGGGSSVVGSSATGTVTVGATDGAAAPTAGGLAGQLVASDLGGHPVAASITGSYATGAVSGGNGSVLGGFAGEVAAGQVSGSYGTGSVTQTSAPLSGLNNDAGGFVGVLTDGGSIDQSYASGAVQTIAGTNTAVHTFAGGFAGDIDSGSSVSDAYALGAVAATGGTVSDVGGFAGIVEQNSTVSGFYATGHVTGSGTTGGLVAIVGDGDPNSGPPTNAPRDTSSISNGYWDEGTTGQTVRGYTLLGTATSATNITGIGGSTGLNPYATATYAHFDLSGATGWYMIPGETRPILRSEYSTTVTNAHQLQLMTLHPAADYVVANDINASETTSAAGVWNPANGFVPVGGNGAASFTGVFDGQGHTISGLSITLTTADPQTPAPGVTTDGAVGLFGFVGPGGALEDVNVANAHVTGGNGMLVGALAGGLLGSVFDASSSGTVTVGNEINTGGGITAIAGGLVGGSAGSITNSHSSASVTGGDAFAGGLLGSAGDGSTVTNSFATGNVIVGSYPAGGVDSPSGGGLVGEQDGASGVSGSFATGSVTGGAGSEVGGLIGGLNGGAVIASYATGAVSGGAGSLAGGFAGIIDNAQVTTSYATGAVTQTVASATVDNLAGGFVGYIANDSVVTDSYASGAVHTVAGTAAPGGPFTFAGGFAGAVDTGSVIDDAYALGAVTATGGTANFDGGFTGVIQGASSVDQVYATGHVISPGTAAGLVGMLGNTGQSAAPVTGFLSNSYWDQGTTGQALGYNQNGSGTPTNVNAVGVGSGHSAYDPASYANFDLTNVWYMIPGETRPILRSEYSTSITNAHQLQLMNLGLGANYTLANNIDASETINPAGVWNTANGFVPVGNDPSAPFTGDLNGAGHTISNLTIIDTTLDKQTTPFNVVTTGAVGLFGYLGGTAENLSIAGHATGGDGMTVGLLAGDLLNHAVVQNVTTSGTVQTGNGVDPANDFANAAAGGLVGSSSGLIENSSSSANVTGGVAAAGGLVGELQAGQIKLSFATGKVTVGGGGTQQIPTAGGLVGSADGESTISGSYATGDVVAGGSSIAGGFVGQSSALIDTSYATGDITQAANLNNTDNRAGGFVGYMFGGQITQSFSSGAVNVTGSDTASIVGGFVGEVDNGGVIMDAYSTSPVTVAGSSSDIAGGFAGDISHGSVTNVLATGAVSAQGSEVAGLVGLVDTSGTITNGYWDEGPIGTAATLGLIGNPVGAVNNVVGMGGATGFDPFDPATYVGFDFATTWSPPSAGNLPQLYGVSHVMLVTAQDTSIVYGNFPVYTINITGLQGGDPASVVKTLNVLPVDAGIANSGYYDVAYFGAPSPDVPPPYTLAPSASGATGGSGAYRIILNDGGPAATDAGLVAGTLTVTPAQLTLTAVSDDRNYDAATDSSATPDTPGLVAGDYIDNLSQSYDQPNVGSVHIMSINDGYVVQDGNNGNNYTVTTSAYGDGETIGGEIDPAPLTVSLTGVTKAYDTTNTASGITADQYTLNGVVNNEDVELSSDLPTSGAYDGVNAGMHTVTVDGVELTGTADMSNYSFDGTASGLGTITQAPLTISAVTDSRQYDGTTLSGQTPTIGETPGVDGLYEGDTITPLTQSFDSKNVMGADGSTLSVNSFTITDGNGGGNYAVTVNTATGTITPAPLVISAVTDSRTYDGDIDSAGMPTVVRPGFDQGPPQTGLLGDDSFTAPLTQSYDSKNVMGLNGSTLTVNSFTINDGNGGANYDVTVNTARGTITAADLTLNPVTETKTYDGTTDAVAPTPKLFGTDTIAITEVFDSKNAGPRTLSISGYSINDGNGGANYDVTVGDPVAGLINQKALTASLVGTVTKTYDGDTTATLTSGNYQLPGVISGDDVSLNDPTSGTYDNRNAGIGKVVTVTGLQISGADAANYTVNGTAAGAIGIITPAALTLTAVTDTKTYDGGVSSDGVPTNSPLIGGDSITGAVQTFGSKNVLGAGGSTLSVTGYTINDGNDGHNYTVTLVSAPGTINPAPLTIAAVTDTKDFDGTTTSTATPDIIGLVGTDTGVATEAFDSKNAGARILSVVGFTIDDGNDGGNYIVTTTTADGTITASATPIVVNPPPTDVIPTDFQSVASFIGGDGTNTTVVNVFPVGAQDPAQAGLGDSSPITGAGNRDLWTGSDDTDKPCPPSSTPCPPAAGTAP